MLIRIASINTLAILLLVCEAVCAEKIAITFDDLPLNGSLPRGLTQVDLVRSTLAILATKNAPPVFGFINAGKLESNPDGATALRLWIEGGQRLGNHTYSHIDLNTNSLEDYGRDILRNEPTLSVLSPHDEWRWFRYPYLREGDVLDKRKGVRAFLREHRYSIAQTTIDYEDYLWNSVFARCAESSDDAGVKRLKDTYVSAATAAIDASRKMSRTLFDRDIDHVLLLHLGAFTPEILPTLLDLLERKGLKLATLETVQADAAYRTDPNYVGRRGNTLLQQHMIARGLDAEPWIALPRAEMEALCR